MAYLPPLNGGRVNVTIGGNTSGAGALISSGSLTLVGGNNVTLSQAGNALTINGANPAAGVAISGGGTLYSTGTLTMSAAGGALTIASAVGQGLNFSVPATSSIVAQGIITMATNGSSISIGAPFQSAQTQANIQALSAGTASAATGTIVFSNSNGVSFGLSGNTMTASAIGGGGGGIAISASNSLFSTNTVNLVAGANAALTISGTSNSINFSVPATSSIVGVNGISIATAGSTISISGNGGGGGGFDGGVSNLGNTQGVTGSNTNGLYLVGGNNITLSQTTNATGAFVTISAGAGGGGGVALSYSNTSYNSGTLNLSALGGMTVSGTSNTVNFSAPGTSALSGTGAVSMSTNGSTVVIGAPQNGTISNWEPAMLQHVSLSFNNTFGNSSLYIHKLQPMAHVSATQLQQLLFISGSTSTDAKLTASYTMAAGIYSANGSTLSLITQSSGSLSFSAVLSSGNAGSTSLFGIRGATIPMNVNMSPGNYWIGFWSRSSFSSSSVSLSISVSNGWIAATSASTFSGLIGAAANNTAGIQEGVGLYMSASSALPVSAPMSAISQAPRNYPVPYMAFKNQTW